MPSPDRIDLLEDRLARLEEIVFKLGGDRAQAVAPGRPAHRTEVPAPKGDQVGTEAPPALSAIVSEQWLGQRGFLAVGVVAALAALGYFLVLAFDRGWISPAVRCGGGAILGLGMAVAGWRLFRRGLLRYGAALIGTGIGMNYLAAWAATRLYGFMPTMGGAITLAGLSVLLAVIALLLNVEWLSAAAVVGGLLAPVFLGVGTGAGTFFLAYLGALILAMGGAAISRHWRLTARLLAGFGLLLLFTAIEARASARALVLYGAAVGLAGVVTGIKSDWREIRLFSFLTGWAALLAAAVTTPSATWLLLAGGVLLSSPAWRAAACGEVAPRHMPGSAPAPTTREPGVGLISAEGPYFYLTAVFLAMVLSGALRASANGTGVALLVVGTAYLTMGWPRAIPAFELGGAIGVAVGGFLIAPTVVQGYWILLVQAVAWASSDHALGRTDGRWFALLPLAGAVYALFGTLMPAPPPEDAAFIGTVSLATWGLVAVAAGLAVGLWRRSDEDPRYRYSVPQLLWGLVGALLLVGVTREIHWYFRQAPFPDRTRLLAGGLLVSAWWAVFAGALVILGFRLRARVIRLAGLAVAGVAAMKVVAIDLATLDALYRVGSVLTLAGVFLGVSFLYNRGARPAPEAQARASD